MVGKAGCRLQSPLACSYETLMNADGLFCFKQKVRMLVEQSTARTAEQGNLTVGPVCESCCVAALIKLLCRCVLCHCWYLCLSEPV